MAKISKINPVLQKMTSIRNEQMLAFLMGDYKSFKKNSQDYAKLAVDHFDLSVQVNSTSIKNVPLFSKTGMKMFKVWFLNLFRKLTPEEVKFQEMYERYKLSKKYIR